MAYHSVYVQIALPSNNAIVQSPDFKNQRKIGGYRSGHSSARVLLSHCNQFRNLLKLLGLIVLLGIMIRTYYSGNDGCVTA